MDKGFTYRGRHSSDLPVTLLSYTVGQPDLREYEDEVDERPGAVDYGTDYGKRPIEMVLLLKETPTRSILALSREMTAWFKPTLPAGLLIFDEEPERAYWAKYTGKLGIEPLARAGQFTLNLKCTDPYAYGPEQITASTLTSSPVMLPLAAGGTEATDAVIELVNTGSTTIEELRLSIEYQLE